MTPANHRGEVQETETALRLPLGNVGTFLAVGVASLGMISGAYAAYSRLESRVSAAEARMDATDKLLDGVATKSDLRVLSAELRLCIKDPGSCPR